MQKEGAITFIIVKWLCESVYPLRRLLSFGHRFGPDP
jgi:hypothetical protein